MATFDLGAWEYLGKRGWVSLGDPVVQQFVDGAFLSGSSNASVAIDLKPSVATFQDMKVKIGRKVYALRRLSTKSSPDVSYEWEERGTWTPYSCDEAETLRLAEASSYKQTTLYVGPRNDEYQIDLNTMQQLNVRTGYIRQIRKVANPNLPTAPSVAPPVVASSSSPAAAAAATAGMLGWEYLSSRGWQAAGDAATQQVIETGFNSSANLLTTTVDSNTATVSFPDMKLRFSNLLFLNRSYPLRRLSSKSAPDVNYEWDDNGVWTPYPCDEAETMRLAEANSNHKQTSLYVGPRNDEYHVDLNTMQQTNVRTGYVRRIRRVASVSAPTQPVAAAAAMTTGAAAAPPPRGGGGGGGGASSSSTTTNTSSSLKYSTDVESVMKEAKIVDMTDCCPICMDDFDNHDQNKAAFELKHCTGHAFHYECIRQQLQLNGKCAMCSYMYIVAMGTQPTNGKMSVQVHSPGQVPLSGVSGCGTIVITYSFPSGVQGPEHPNPGTRYAGTSRVAYLPDNAEGREILRMFDICFKRRLTFTVGRSITTGADNCVVWNGVHHKTGTSGGTSNFGYPDPTYFARVKDELKAKGIS